MTLPGTVGFLPPVSFSTISSVYYYHICSISLTLSLLSCGLQFLSSWLLAGLKLLEHRPPHKLLPFWSPHFSFHHPATGLHPSFLHVPHFFTSLSLSWHQFFSLNAVYTSLLNSSSLTGHYMDACSLSKLVISSENLEGFPLCCHPFFLNRISSSVFSFTQLANRKHERHP